MMQEPIELLKALPDFMEILHFPNNDVKGILGFTLETLYGTVPSPYDPQTQRFIVEVPSIDCPADTTFYITYQSFNYNFEILRRIDAVDGWLQLDLSFLGKESA